MAKIKHHFFYTFESRKVNRTYGGEEFVLGVWENKGRGGFEKIGTYKGCTRSHKGFESDAWGVVIENRPRIKELCMNSGYMKRHLGYYSWTDAETLGIKLEHV